MARHPLSAEQLALLAQVDSPTIANVIELFDFRSHVAGYSNARLKAIYPELPPAVGYAVTATFRAGYPAETESSYSSMPQVLREAETLPAPRMMVFQDLDDPIRAATYGEIMATSFQTFGFAGLITSGAGRDIEQVRRLNFPCWATSVLVSHGHSRFAAINVPVMVAGLEVAPGDLLHADANGVMHIPHRIAPMVAELCAGYIAAEQVILDYLHAANATLEGYTSAVEQSKRAMAHLRESARNFLASNA